MVEPLSGLGEGEMAEVVWIISEADVREMLVPINHPIIGEMKVNGNPVKLMDTVADISHPAPTLGEYNEAVYGELLGFTKEDLDKLASEKII